MKSSYVQGCHLCAYVRTVESWHSEAYPGEKIEVRGLHLGMLGNGAGVLHLCMQQSEAANTRFSRLRHRMG